MLFFQFKEKIPLLTENKKWQSSAWKKYLDSKIWCVSIETYSIRNYSYSFINNIWYEGHNNVYGFWLSNKFKKKSWSN